MAPTILVKEQFQKTVPYPFRYFTSIAKLGQSPKKPYPTFLRNQNYILIMERPRIRIREYIKISDIDNCVGNDIISARTYYADDPHYANNSHLKPDEYEIPWSIHDIMIPLPPK